MKTMISKIAHIYDGRCHSRRANTFEAHDEYVDALQLLGRAELAPIESQSRNTKRAIWPQAQAQYERRDAAAAAAPHPKRKYNTKRKAS